MKSLLDVGKEELQSIVDESSSYKEIIEKIGLKPIGNNYKTINRLIRHYNIDTAKLAEKRKKLTAHAVETPYEDIFSGKIVQMIKPQKSIQYLVRTGRKKYSCEKCGISEWNGGKITLELHHKDGNHTNNRLENLEILCPNCHSQTENFRFKNKKHNR